MRFAIRRLLWGDLAYEEDPQFAEAARAVVTAITDDLDLQLTIALNSQGHYEFVDEIGPPKGRRDAIERAEQLWGDKIQATAKEFIRVFPEVAAGIWHLDKLMAECQAAGYSPNFGNFFSAITKLDQGYGTQLAQTLLDPACSAQVAVAWYNLLYGFPPEANSVVRDLLRRAQRHPRTEVRTGIILYLRSRTRSNVGFDEEEKALIEELAAHAGLAEVMMLIDLVQWLSDASAPWGFALLEKVPLSQVTVQQDAYGSLLEALHPL